MAAAFTQFSYSTSNNNKSNNNYLVYCDTVSLPSAETPFNNNTLTWSPFPTSHSSMFTTELADTVFMYHYLWIVCTPLYTVSYLLVLCLWGWIKFIELIISLQGAAIYGFYHCFHVHPILYVRYISEVTGWVDLLSSAI